MVSSHTFSCVFFLCSFVILPFASLHGQAGCTDPQAENYDPQATFNNGSCTFKNLLLKPTELVRLPATIDESSGLVWVDSLLWTHNDSKDQFIYGLDPASGSVVKKIFIANAQNEDWEDIGVDKKYLYIADIGNNFGNRKNLRFFRIEKAQMSSDSVEADTIRFSFSDQTDFSPKADNQTDFDAEAFVVRDDSIYVFTKQWITAQTKVYVLPAIPGHHVAQLIDRFNVNGLITGAVAVDSLQVVALCGYTKLLQPFVFLLYDFRKNDFFGGNKRRLNLELPFHQIEGIATNNGLQFYLSNETFTAPLINSVAKVFTLDLYPYLRPFLQKPTD